MRFLLMLSVIFLVTTIALSQSNVDRLVEELEFLSRGSLNNWKYSTDFSIDPVKATVDDAGWKNLTLDESIFPDSCWLRKEIVLPDRMLGQPVKGRVKFLVSVDDYGFLWVNGESKGYFPWDGEFVLTEDARPQQRFLLVIKAINTGGPLRLIRAEIQTESSSDLRTTIEDFGLGLRVGQKLLSFDTYQTNARRKEDPGTDRSRFDRTEKQRLADLLQSVAPTVNIQALKDGDIDAFKVSLEETRRKLKPVADFARQFSLFFNSNAHIDAAWLWRKQETIEVCKNTFGSVMNMMKARPDFTYTQSSAAFYDWMERFYPSLFEQVKSRVAEGRWEVTGGMWVEPDCNLPGGESWNRHLLYSKRYFKKKFNVDVKIGWNPDSFGYNWNMPQFYQQAGIDAFVTQKIGWNDTNVFPHRLFWWEGPDGSRILSYFPFNYVNSIDDPFQLIDWLRQYESNTGFTKMLVLFGIGNHGGGPSLEMLDRIDRLRSVDIFPTIEHGTSMQYMDWIKSHDLSTVPVWKNELYLEYHQGTYTTQSAMKERNRKSEILLTQVEKFSSLASLYGREYNATSLETAWRNVLFNQFHDILPGSGIREVYIDANEDFDKSAAIGEFELTDALQSIANQVSTSNLPNGEPVIIFNPLAWERSDIVTVKLPRGDRAEYSVVDARNKSIASQVVTNNDLDREIIFVSSNIPALGYATYVLKKGPASQSTTDLTVDESQISNENFVVTIDPDSGWVNSIRDKRSSKELLAGKGNELQLLEDRPSAWDAWNIGLTGVKYPSRFRGAEVIENGPIRAILRLHRDYLKPGVVKDFPTEDFPSSFFTQDIILYSRGDCIEFRTGVDWWEEKTMLKVAFPLTFVDTIATYDIPFGTIRRSTGGRTSWEKAQIEVPAQRWADVSAEGNGVSLLTKSKYGFDIKGNVMRLSLLRSPKWPDPTADRGKHSISYALYPHQQSWKEAGTIRRSMEYNQSLMPVATKRHNGKLPSTYSFLKIGGPGIILTSIKRAEDDNAWVIQWYESEGRGTTTTVELPATIRKACYSNFIEENGSAIEASGRKISVETKANTVTTVKVWF